MKYPSPRVKQFPPSFFWRISVRTNAKAKTTAGKRQKGQKLEIEKQRSRQWRLSRMPRHSICRCRKLDRVFEPYAAQGDLDFVHCFLSHSLFLTLPSFASPAWKSPAFSRGISLFPYFSFSTLSYYPLITYKFSCNSAARVGDEPPLGDISDHARIPLGFVDSIGVE